MGEFQGIQNKAAFYISRHPSAPGGGKADCTAISSTGFMEKKIEIPYS